MRGDELTIRGLKIVADEYNTLLQRRIKISFDYYEEIKKLNNWKETITNKFK